MLKLSAFADEISPDLDEQLDVLESEGIRHIEFRGVWNKNVLKLNDEELKRMRETLNNRGFSISCIGSPIGKIQITDDFETHLQDFERAIFCANYFNTPFIRIFSFFIPPEEETSKFHDEVMRRMQTLVTRAETAGITLLHENEKGIYGENPERCLEIHTECASQSLRCAFDPANFVQSGIRPFSEAFPLLSPYVSYIHIKDAKWVTGKEVPAGLGDGQIHSLLSHLKCQKYEGFLSIEPHLSQSGRFKGYSGPDLFREAAQALKGLLKELEIEWS